MARSFDAEKYYSIIPDIFEYQLQHTQLTCKAINFKDSEIEAQFKNMKETISKIKSIPLMP